MAPTMARKIVVPTMSQRSGLVIVPVTDSLLKLSKAQETGMFR